jgi:hypothetical protein
MTRTNANRSYTIHEDLVKWSLYVTQAAARAVDWARGDTSRMEWIREAVNQRLERERAAKAPEPKVPGGGK